MLTFGYKVVIFTYFSCTLLLNLDLSLAFKNRNRTRPGGPIQNCVWTRCSSRPLQCPTSFVTKMTVPCGKPRGRMRTRSQCCRNPDQMVTALPPGISSSTTDSMTTTTTDSVGECKHVDITEFPHQVALVRQSSPDGTMDAHFCSGAIYDENFIITSASCVQNDELSMAASNIVVRTGDTNLNNFEGTEQILLVDKIIIHENYQAGAQENDIALLKLTNPILLTGDDGSFNKWVSPLTLPRSGFDTSTAGSGSVAGWPVTQLFVGNSGDPSLQSSTAQINPGQACGTCRLCVISDDWHPNCRADLGSAIICNDGRSTVGCGIFSLSSSSATSPSIYSDLTCYIEWLRNVVETNSILSLSLGFTNSSGIIVDLY